MAIATKFADVQLFTGTGVIACRTGGGRAEVVGGGLDDENIRNVIQDPFNPQHLYACSVTDMYTSEDGGETWTWLPAGGVDFREIWSMAVHPGRPNEVR